MSNFWQRTFAGAVFIVVLVASISFSKFTFGALFLFFTIIGVLEFYKLSKLDNANPLKTYGTIVSGLLFVASFIFAFNEPSLPIKLLALIIPLCFVVFVIELYRKPSPRPFTNIAYTILGVVYVALPFSTLNFIVTPTFGSSEYHPNILLGYFIIVWCNDTGGYLVGRSFGKRKLFERISPKKSWEGTFGGAALSAIAAFAVAHFYNDLRILDWIIVASIIVVVGSLGDLVESLFKRSINVKDSGAFLPGHGGVLDRFDALLLSAPFVYSYIVLIQ